MNKKLKVVWITEFSNSEVRARIPRKPNLLECIIKRLKGQKISFANSDLGQWVTNGIHEFEKFEDVELHVIAPFSYLADDVVRFIQNGIFYYFINNEFRTSKEMLLRQLCKHHLCKYRKNSKRIVQLVNDISPDIIHLIGAENEHYALSILDLPHEYPILTQLQTFVNDPEFKQNYVLSDEAYTSKAKVEREVLKRTDFIGIKLPKYAKLVHDFIDKDKLVLNTTLALTEPVNLSPCEKAYDFVYFSKELEKAGDWAIEAFGILAKKKTEATLLMVGGYSTVTYAAYTNRMRELGILDKVTFAGKQESHDDVIARIRQATFAILPLKIDFISGTIREAMANGLPVVTTITPGTPMLNQKRESIILSEKEDFKSMALNMQRLMDDCSFAESIRKNAAITASERSSNYDDMRHWVDVYKVIIENKNSGTSISEHYITKD